MAGHDYETMRICVHAYLRHVRGVEATLSSIAEDIARVEAGAELLGASLVRTGPAARSPDKAAEGLARAEELRERWSEAMALHADELAEAKRLCRPVHESRRALWLHVVERATWAETARELGYSSAHARRLAEVGVRELYALMPERWRREPIPNAAPR